MRTYEEAIVKAKDIFHTYNVRVECLGNDDYIRVSVEGKLMSGGWVSRSFLNKTKIGYNKTQIVQKELFIQIIKDLS